MTLRNRRHPCLNPPKPGVVICVCNWRTQLLVLGRFVEDTSAGTPTNMACYLQTKYGSVFPDRATGDRVIDQEGSRVLNLEDVEDGDRLCVFFEPLAPMHRCMLQLLACATAIRASSSTTSTCFSCSPPPPASSWAAAASASVPAPASAASPPAPPPPPAAASLLAPWLLTGCVLHLLLPLLLCPCYCSCCRCCCHWCCCYCPSVSDPPPAAAAPVAAAAAFALVVSHASALFSPAPAAPADPASPAPLATGSGAIAVCSNPVDCYSECGGLQRWQHLVGFNPPNFKKKRAPPKPKERPRAPASKKAKHVYDQDKVTALTQLAQFRRSWLRDRCGDEVRLPVTEHHQQWPSTAPLLQDEVSEWFWPHLGSLCLRPAAAQEASSLQKYHFAKGHKRPLSACAPHLNWIILRHNQELVTVSSGASDNKFNFIGSVTLHRHKDTVPLDMQAFLCLPGEHTNAEFGESFMLNGNPSYQNVFPTQCQQQRPTLALHQWAAFKELVDAGLVHRDACNGSLSSELYTTSTQGGGRPIPRWFAVEVEYAQLVQAAILKKISNEIQSAAAAASTTEQPLPDPPHEKFPVNDVASCAMPYFSFPKSIVREWAQVERICRCECLVGPVCAQLVAHCAVALHCIQLVSHSAFAWHSVCCISFHVCVAFQCWSSDVHACLWPNPHVTAHPAALAHGGTWAPRVHQVSCLA